VGRRREELGLAVIAQGSGPQFIGGARANKAAEKGVRACRKQLGVIILCMQRQTRGGGSVCGTAVEESVMMVMN
jgi:hypothetical protein